MPGHEESIGILGDKIRPWEGLEKSGHTNRHRHGHPQIIIWMMNIIAQVFFRIIIEIFHKCYVISANSEFTYNLIGKKI